MNYKEILQGAGVFITFMVAAGAGFGGFWYAFRSKEQKILKERVEENYRLLEACELRHKENEKRIEDLEKKIDHTINIPLRQIAEHMDKTAKILTKLEKKL